MSSRVSDLVLCTKDLTRIHQFAGKAKLDPYKEYFTGAISFDGMHFIVGVRRGQTSDGIIKKLLFRLETVHSDVKNKSTPKKVALLRAGTNTDIRIICATVQKRSGTNH